MMALAWDKLHYEFYICTGDFASGGYLGDSGEILCLFMFFALRQDLYVDLALLKISMYEAGLNLQGKENKNLVDSWLKDKWVKGKCRWPWEVTY